jgi:hypothetical protein
MTEPHGRSVKSCVTALLLLFPCALASIGLSAQDSVSACSAQELSDLLRQRKLDSIATKDPEESDRFIAALLYPEVSSWSSPPGTLRR